MTPQKKSKDDDAELMKMLRGQDKYIKLYFKSKKKAKKVKKNGS